MKKLTAIDVDQPNRLVDITDDVHVDVRKKVDPRRNALQPLEHVRHTQGFA